MLDPELKQHFHWDDERDGSCSAVLDNDGHPRRCDRKVVGAGFWFFVYPPPGHWVTKDACEIHRRFLVARAWKVGEERPWVASVG
jgi:hypothetical protein